MSAGENVGNLHPCVIQEYAIINQTQEKNFSGHKLRYVWHTRIKIMLDVLKKSGVHFRSRLQP